MTGIQKKDGVFFFPYTRNCLYAMHRDTGREETDIIVIDK